MLKKIIIIIIIIFISALGCVVLQRSIVGRYGYSINEESMTYLPAHESIKPFLLGYETVFANYLWIRTVLYFGHHYMGDKEFVYLEKMLDIISKLNPHFYPVYEFSGLMIPEMTGNINAARIMLDRGIFYLGKQKYNLAFYMGVIHYRYFQDRVLAAQYFTLASHADNAPVEKLARMTAAFLTKEPNTSRSLAMMAFLYQTSENPEVKRYLAESMEKLYAQEVSGNSDTSKTPE